MSTESPPREYPPPSPQELVKRIQDVLGAVAGELKRAGDQKRLDEMDTVLCRPARARPLVIVTGETNTGKSSLVNALLRRPGLSPVDYDIATGACVMFEYSEQERVRVQRFDEESLDIGLDEIDVWASILHNPGNHKRVRCVEVGLDVPLLRAVTLVDTPGCGTLDSVHAGLTLAALREAEALVFTSTADGVLTTPELNFLEAAAERIDAVILVLTKIDEQSHDWRRVDADDAEALRRRGERFAGFARIAVCHPDAEEALSSPDDPDAAQLFEESGVPAVERAIIEQCDGRGNAIRLANAVRYADSSLRALDADLTDRMAAQSGDPAVKEALERERERLAALQRDKANWNRKLDTQLRKINLDRADAVSHAFAELRVHFDAIASEKKADELADLPDQLLEEISLLAERIAADTTDSIRAVVAEILGEIDAGSDLAELVGEIERVAVQNGMRLGPPLERSTTGFDRLTTLQSWSSGRSIGGYAVSLPMFAIGGVPLLVGSFAVATLFAWKAHGGRKLLTRQADFRQWQREQIALVQLELNNEFSRKMIDVQPAIADAIRDYLSECEQRLVGTIEETEKAQRAGAEERKQNLEATAARKERCREVIASTTQLLEILRTARG